MLSLLCLILGLAFLCGLNLYLTTFLLSLSLRQGWISQDLSPALAPLAHPALLSLALLLFLLEFILDKIPWVDTLWDALHTLIRPAGAAALAFALLSSTQLSPLATSLAAAAAGLVALAAHLTKSGLRLLINASPEPFSNSLASLAEDAAVAALLFWLLRAPVTGAAACAALLLGTWILLPRLIRLLLANLLLLGKKAFGAPTLPSLPLAPGQSRQLTDLFSPATTPAWAVPCLSGSSQGLPGLRPNHRGTLVAPFDHPGTLCFLFRKRFQPRAVRFSLVGAQLRQEDTFLSSNLVIHRPQDHLLLTFRFPRPTAPHLAALLADLQSRLGRDLPQPPPILTAPTPLATPALASSPATAPRLQQLPP